jgi:hypothetical protein
MSFPSAFPSAFESAFPPALGEEGNSSAVLALDQRIAAGGGTPERGLIEVQTFLDRLRELGLPRPSFVWDPVSSVAGTSYAVIPESGAGDLTVTRATIGTRHNRLGTLVDEANNVPRLDFDPITGVFRAVIIEPAVTSFAPTSEDFASASWDKQEVTVGTSVTSPRGTATAQPIVPSTNNAGQALTHTTTRASGVWTSSIHAQAAGYSHICLIAYINTTNWVRLTFNVTTGALTETLSGGGSTFTALTARPFQTAGFGYNRFGMSFNSASSNFAIGYAPANSATPAAGDFGWPEFAGDGTSGVRMFGAQLESGSRMTSYVPVSSASATRNADAITLSAAGGVVGQAEGTIYARANVRPLASAAARRIVNIRVDGSNVISIDASTTSQVYEYSVSTSGTTVAGITSGAIAGPVQVAGAYKTDDFAFVINGSVIGTDTSGAIPNLSATALGLGVRADAAASTHLDGNLFVVALFPVRLTNTQLQALTTL